MPHSDDDDEFPIPVRASSPPPARSASPAATATTTAPAALTFGRVGRTAVGPVTQVDGPPNGLVRTALSAGVGYAPPPPSVRGVGCLFRWLPAFGAERQFELPLPDDVPRAAVSLAAWQRSAPADARPNAIDDIADKLLALTAELHAAGWRLGLLAPDTVFRLPDGQLLLPDLGFAWRPATGAPPWDDDLTKPSWLNRDGEFAGLFPAPPACLQLARPDDWKLYPPFADDDGAGGRTADLKLLARLFAFLRSGVIGPAVGDGILAEVEAGKVPTADEFRQRLRKSPVGTPPRAAGTSARKPGGARALWMGVGAAAVIGLAVGGYLLFGGKSDPPVAVNPDTVNPSPEPVTPNPKPPPDPVTPTPPDPVPPTPAPPEPPPRTLAEVQALVAASAAKPDDAAARAAARAEWFKEFALAVKDGADKRDPTAFSVKMTAMGDLLTKLPKATDPTLEQEEKRWADYCAQFR